MKAIDAQYSAHLLVCVNKRPEGKVGCGDFGGEEFYLECKRRVQTSGLTPTHWVTRTRCLGFCNNVGTTVTISRPDEKPQWYTEVTLKDLDWVYAQFVR